jgi:hypothetical protein
VIRWSKIVASKNGKSHKIKAQKKASASTDTQTMFMVEISCPPYAGEKAIRKKWLSTKDEARRWLLEFLKDKTDICGYIYQVDVTKVETVFSRMSAFD